MRPADRPAGFLSEDMLDRSFGTLPFVDKTLRLLPPELGARAAKWRFAFLFVFVLLLHLAVVVALLYRAGDTPEQPPSEEVPIEVVTEMPKPPEPEQPKPEEKKQEQKKPEQQKPKYEQSLKPAYDAPRAPNEEKVEREAPEKETHAPQQQAQPVQQPPAEKPAQVETPKVAAVPTQERQEQTNQPVPDEDKPDAEALSKAELQMKADKAKSNSDPAKTKKPLPIDQKTALSRQLAALAPTPDYTLGSMSKPAIVSGGTENTTYLSILYGLIMKHVSNKEVVRSSPGQVVIFFSLDENGNLTHQVVYKGSGFPDIDQETLEAVRRSAPFPPPPRDIPHKFFFSRDVERGR
jgi:TonB family protein